MDIGKSLKLALVIKELSQKELAENFQVHHQVVSRWCNSEDSGMSLTTLVGICFALDMKVSDFIALGED